MTNIQQRSITLLINILSAKYFLDELSATIGKQGVTVDGINKGMYSDQELILLWNEFWIDLPDDLTIRRAPFLELCDLCEEIFDGQDEPEDD